MRERSLPAGETVETVDEIVVRARGGAGENAGVHAAGDGGAGGQNAVIAPAMAIGMAIGQAEVAGVDVKEAGWIHPDVGARRAERPTDVERAVVAAAPVGIFHEGEGVGR